MGSRPRARRLSRQGRDVQGRARRRDPGGRGRQDLPSGRLVRSLPRTAHALDRPGRRRLQADQARRRLLARRPEPSATSAHLRHRLAVEGGARCLPTHARGGGETRPSKDRPRVGAVPPAGRGARTGVLAPEGVGDLAVAGSLRAPPSRPRGLSGGQDAAAARPEALGSLRPLGEVPRVDVPGGSRGGERRRQASRGFEAHELPGPRPNLQPGHQVVSRPAAALRRVWLMSSLRAVGCHARHYAGARLHAGRWAHLLPRGSDHYRGRGLLRTAGLDLPRPGLQLVPHQVLRPAGETCWFGRGVGPGGSRVDGGDQAPRATRRSSTRARGRSTDRSSNSC